MVNCYLKELKFLFLNFENKSRVYYKRLYMYCNNREVIYFSVLEYFNNINVYVVFKIFLKN